MPCPWYRPEDGLKFLEAHGLAVRAVGGPSQTWSPARPLLLMLHAEAKHASMSARNRQQ